VLVWPPRGHRVRRRRVAFFSHGVVVVVNVSLKSVKCKKQVSSGYLLLSVSRMIDSAGALGRWCAEERQKGRRRQGMMILQIKAESVVCHLSAQWIVQSCFENRQLRVLAG
jgi:hypothetical protein